MHERDSRPEAWKRYPRPERRQAIPSVGKVVRLAVRQGAVVGQRTSEHQLFRVYLSIGQLSWPAVRPPGSSLMLTTTD